MTYQARQVLFDCRVTLQLLEEKRDLQRWRVHWAAAVALIRAVGHVLDKVDGRDQAVKQVAATMYRNWKGTDPEHLIFREFIEKERNNLLKEYEINIHPLDDVPVVVQAVLCPPDGGEPHMIAVDVMEMGDNVYRPMMEGPWEGDDAREVLTEAIEWWEGQLNAVDEIVARGRSGGSRGR
ncbi:MAG TPA: hypothetical protein VMU69_25150 [Bradyrhizobium sp.]|nr:hypothetical protein [Bradyrhizobium sp.]